MPRFRYSRAPITGGLILGSLTMPAGQNMALKAVPELHQGAAGYRRYYSRAFADQGPGFFHGSNRPCDDPRRPSPLYLFEKLFFAEQRAHYPKWSVPRRIPEAQPLTSLRFRAMEWKLVYPIFITQIVGRSLRIRRIVGVP